MSAKGIAPRPASSPRSRLAHELLALVLLAAVPSLPTLFAPLFADDYYHLAKIASPGVSATSAWVLDFASLGAWWTPPGMAVPYLRPLVYLSFRLDHALFGDLAAGDHATSIALHVACTLLVRAIARSVLGEERPRAALACAALFAIHPAHAEAVAWISARTDLLATLFVLCAFLAQRASRGREGPARLAIELACLAALALGLAAKELAVALVPLLFVDALARGRDETGLESRSRRLALPLAAFAVAVAWLVVRARLLGGIAPPYPVVHRPGDPDFLRHALTAPLVYLIDLVLYVGADPVLLGPLYLRHPLAFALLAALALALLVDTARRATGATRTPTIVLGAAFVLFGLLPSLPASLGERYLYLPSVGHCLLVAARVPEPPVASSRILARAHVGAGLLGALLLLVLVGKEVAFGGIARRSRVLVDDAARALDEAPAARTLLVVDLPAGASLAFPQALALVRPHHLVDVGVLSITPDLLLGDPPPASRITRAADGSLRLRRDPLLDGYTARALLGPAAPPAPGTLVEKRGYEVRVTDGAAVGPTAITVRPTDPARTVILRAAVDGATRERHLVPLR